MADYDYQANGYNAGNLIVPEEPATIAAMKAALKAKNATSYSDARLYTMTYRDLLYAARLEKVTVNATLPFSTNYPL